MKKIEKCLLVLLLILSLVGCGDSEKEEETVTQNKTQETQENKEIEETVDTTITDAFSVDVVDNGDSKTITFSRMLKSVDDLKQLDITDEYISACAIIFTLAEYEEDPDSALEMLEFINGPEDISDYDGNFMKNQMEQYPYVMRSYFDGTSPENNYEVKEVTLTIKENVYSREEEGYVQLWFHSSGADSDRAVKLRIKNSTGEWFLFSDTYKGLMAGIRIPASEDKWS